MDSENKEQIVYSFDKVVTLAELERKHIATALNRAGGNKTHAAAALGITLKTLYNKLNAYAKEANETNTEQK